MPMLQVGGCAACCMPCSERTAIARCTFAGNLAAQMVRNWSAQAARSTPRLSCCAQAIGVGRSAPRHLLPPGLQHSGERRLPQAQATCLCAQYMDLSNNSFRGSVPLQWSNVSTGAQPRCAQSHRQLLTSLGRIYCRSPYAAQPGSKLAGLCLGQGRQLSELCAAAACPS